MIPGSQPVVDLSDFFLEMFAGVSAEEGGMWES
jgi:hypothetical protein